LFINDLPKAVQESKVLLFTDYTNILLIEKNLTSLKGKIIKVMKQLENWFLTSNLIINTEKTKAVLFHGRGSRLIHRSILYLNNKEITYLSNLKLFRYLYHRKVKLSQSYTISLTKIKQSSLFE
jgi:hypothetical protein